MDFFHPVKADFIVINNESVKNLKWLKDHFTFDQIVLNKRNSVYYIRKMKSQANMLGLNIHALQTDGALRIPLGTKKERTAAQLN